MIRIVPSPAKAVWLLDCASSADVLIEGICGVSSTVIVFSAGSVPRTTVNLASPALFRTTLPIRIFDPPPKSGSFL